MKLSEFIDIEMKKREMGVREFAKFVDVSHSLISKHLNEKDISPSMEFLVKLSDATGISLRTILGLAFPEIAGRLAVNPGVDVIAEEINSLPQSTQDVLLGFIRGSK